MRNLGMRSGFGMLAALLLAQGAMEQQDARTRLGAVALRPARRRARKLRPLDISLGPTKASKRYAKRRKRFQLMWRP